jgi:hypothetical protein
LAGAACSMHRSLRELREPGCSLATMSSVPPMTIKRCDSRHAQALRERIADALGGRLRLDRRLAAGLEDPLASRALSRRAAVLCRARTRHVLAAEVERMVIEAERPPRRLGAAVPIDRQQVLDARMELSMLAAAIRTAANPGRKGSPPRPS